MADERNIAHDKKVMQEKEHRGEATAPEGATRAPQPGKKTPVDEAHHKSHTDKVAKAGGTADDDAAE